MLPYFAHQSAISADILPQMRDRLPRADACKVANVRQQLDSGRSHSVAAGADKPERAGAGGLFQLSDDPGGVTIRRCLAGDDQDIRPIVLYRHVRSRLTKQATDFTDFTDLPTNTHQLS